MADVTRAAVAAAGVAPAKVAHNVPGRLRLKFEPGVDVHQASARIQEAVGSYPGVQSVHARDRTRSVVVSYSPAELEVQRLIEEGLPAAAVELLDTGIEAVAAAVGSTAVGGSIVKTVGGANRRLERATGGVLDLRDAFPLTLFGFGIRRVLQGNLQPIPWYNLLYYGYSTFVALHARRGGQGGQGGPALAAPDAVEIVRQRFARGEITRAQYRRMLAELEPGTGDDQTSEGAGASGEERQGSE